MDRHALRRLTPLKTVSIYFVFGVIWIAFTDWLLVTRIEAPELVTLVETISAWGFLGASSLLILGLTYTRQQQVQHSQEVLRTATEKLQVLHRVFRHNIRNDINVIQGHIELVQQQQRSERDNRAKLEIARQTAAHITAVSDKVKVINEVEPDLPTSEEIDLVALTNREIDRIRARYPEITVSTAMPDSISIMGDATLRYAVREVFENAVEHNTKPMAERELEIQVSRQYGQVTLVITDNGPSIPQEELDVLRRGEETDLSHTSGVGLWLVTWLSRHHDGEVGFDTAPGQGTTVTFRFKVGTDIPLYQSRSNNWPNPATTSVT